MDQQTKDLFEKVKQTASSVGEAAASVAKTSANKAGKFLDSTKANIQVFNLNNDVDILFKRLGKILYENHKSPQIEIDSAEIDGLFAVIDEKKVAIAELREKISANKSTQDCLKCGNVCKKEDLFCSKCGEML